VETLLDLDLVRAVPAALSPVLLRADSDGQDGADGGLGRLVVRFSPFNVWYEIHSWWEGDFLERTVRGTFAKTMVDNKESIRALFDHGGDPSIGSKPISTVDDLREEADSAVLEGDLLDADYVRELVPGLRAGVYGSSFRFRVVREEWNDDPGVSDYNPKGLPERTITEAKLFEAGPVTFPANPSATAGLRSDKAIRSASDEFYAKARLRDPKVDGLLARALELRAPDAPPGKAPASARPGGAASKTEGEPREHSLGSTPAQRRALMYPEMKGALR